MKKYIIKTERLGLRNWIDSDLDPFIAMSRDKEVMYYFSKLLSEQESEDFIYRMQDHFKNPGFCYFAVDLLETNEFLGFTGILHQTFESEYTPCVDIGWRLKKAAWGKGYATEAAKACLEEAFTKFNINEIYSFAPEKNINSEAVMKKIGMNFIDTFQHPMIINDPRFRECVVYSKQY